MNNIIADNTQTLNLISNIVTGAFIVVTIIVAAWIAWSELFDD